MKAAHARNLPSDLNSGKDSTVGFSLDFSTKLSTLLTIVKEYRLISRLTTVWVMAALLSPLFLLQATRPASANSPIAQAPVPTSAPPEPFVISSSSYLSSTIAGYAPASIVQLNTIAAKSYSSVVNYFTTPTLPAGFALAQPSSPFVNSVTSTFASFKSFLGLAVTSAKSAGLTAPSAASAAAESAPVAAPNLLYSQPAGNVWFDFDMDGKADISRWHPATKEWKVKLSSTGTYLTQTLGTSSSALIAPGDYDGDNKTDAAIFSAGTWTILYSSLGSNPTPQTVALGASGDKPIVGDFDGDGMDDLAVFTPATATWTIRKSNSGSPTTVTTQFGAAGDLAVADDYDGDGKADIAVYRPSTGTWYVQASTAGFSSTQWGSQSDIPVPADYDGDGKTDKAVFRPSNGTWYLYQSLNGTSTLAWGNFGDQPVPADYDGDGKADLAVWRPTTGVWHIYQSANGYSAQTLGVTGDTAISSAYLKQIGSQVYSYDFAKTRLSPKNGMGDTDLYSQNFSWGAGLVNLPGRAGLDAGLGISYNSLVWTKDNSTMVFDADKSNVSPGFRFGFPVIEPVYYDSASQNFNYLMVTPSGAKVEFKQIAASSTFETADSSYAQLTISRFGLPSDPVETQGLTVTTTDGTMMTYSWIGDAYRCTQIKDRNGNYMTIENDEYGLLKKITDTLGRIITVNYDADNSPISIVQDWKDTNGSGATQTHTYATFNYTTVPMYTGFATTLGVYGPATGNIKALQSIVYPNGSSTRFDYNPYGQVYKVSNIGADSSVHVLNSTEINLQYPASGQTDCPRFTQTNNYAENFNLDTNNQAQPVVIYNSVTPNSSYTLPGNATQTATKIEVSMLYHPNGAVSKTYVGASGWQEGLPLATEDIADGARKRWTQTVWTQDNTGLSYILNPRVTETRVGDTSNVKRTVIDYQTQTGTDVSLPTQVDVYDSNQTTVKKRQMTAYNINSAYLSRRIIGLPVESDLFEGPGTTLVSKMTYGYDEGNFTDTTLNQNLTTVTQHDHGSRAYNSSFIIGRGNLTSVTRWNTEPGHTGESVVVSKLKYNTAGGVVAQLSQDSNSVDPTNPTRMVKIGYTDAFVDNLSNSLNRNTFAYPTTITDPASNASTIRYRYDIGANVWAQSPAPQNQTTGKTSERLFDAVGRLEKQKIDNNGGAYTRYEYPSNGVQTKVYSTVTDYNSSGTADSADEVLSENWTDGAGRVRQSQTAMPNSSGGYSGQLIEYDILGRVKRQSVPTEVSFNATTGVLTPTGDDNLGNDSQGKPIWLWTAQFYDWKGRVTQETNTDGTYKSISYDGCGCAGGQITTIQGEEIFEKDWQENNSTSLGRRTQKVYADILGRAVKTQVMEWDGTTPYMTTVNTFNVRDQITKVQQYAGAETASPAAANYHETTMSYDGHGRLKTQHLPQQDTTAATTYNYNLDDSIQSTVDGRGASSNYTYNSRGLVQEISYTPSAAVPDTPTVTFGYDNAGNRISMNEDGFGAVTYAYNELSQMTSETRTFSDTLANAPSGGFNLTYEYALGGQLKSLTDPYGQKINYAYDKIGRLNSVIGATSFGGITTYASNPQYRAWGGLKSLSYGNQTQMAMTYNNRLQADHYEFNKTGQSQAIMSKNYEYYADGNLRKLDDTVNDIFDRLNTYDNLGRPKTGLSGAEARGGTVTQANMETNLPYRQSYTYNAFNNLTQRNNLHWGVDTWAGQSNNLTYTYQNNRITNTNWTYDADGHVLVSSLPDDGMESTYDAKGQLVRLKGTSDIYRYYNGDGREAKRKKLDLNANVLETKYFIRSTVMGGETVSETDATGRKLKTFVRAAGATLAWQTVYHYNNTDDEYVNFEQWDASAMSYRSTVTDGSQIFGEGAEGSPAELDLLGSNVGLSTPYYESQPPVVEPEFPSLGGLFYESPVFVNGQRVTATMDGFAVPLSTALNALASGSANISGGTSSWVLSQIGVFAVWEPNSDRTAPQNPHTDPNSDAPTNTFGDGGTYSYYFSNISWNLQQQINNVPFNIPKITQIITDTLKNKSCKDFIDDLLKKASAITGRKLAEGGDVLNMFNVVKNNLTRTRPPGGAKNSAANPVGSFKEKDAGIFVAGDPKTNATSQLMSDVGHILHELLHLAAFNGKYFTDKDFADIVHNSPNSSIPYTGENAVYPLNPYDTSKLTKKQVKELNEQENNAKWSAYWDRVLQNKCF